MTNPSTSQSYINKDFASIYAELLDVAKQLSTKWDPSISDESDPGVVLLKLNAIIADKNNYNIDSNVLEFYPESASQELNVRNIFNQLGYRMSWYKSGTSTVSITRSNIVSSLTIPRFTQLSTEDSTIVYTLLNDVLFERNEQIKQGTVIAGKYSLLSVDGTTSLTYKNLDSDNRLYFPDSNVSENGIFINTFVNGVATNDFESWSKVDNNLLQPSYTKCYEFGVDARYGTPYIEFASEFSSVVPESFQVGYVITNGEADNVNIRALNSFFDTNSSVVDGDGTSFSLDADNFSIQNDSSILTCYSPESIEAAKINYKKTLGTFKTLVSLRDYLNYLQESGLVANCVVTDRTNDTLVSNYSKVVNENLKTQRTQFFETSDDSLSAFSLKLYGLQFVGNPATMTQFTRTFTLCGSDVVADVVNQIATVKSIQHDIISPAANKLTILKNKYDLTFKIHATKTLTTAEKSTIISDIQTSLFDNLNSGVIEFGDAITYNDVYNVIKSSNSNIDYISLDNIIFYTYAPYFNTSGDIIEICISDQNPYIEGVYTNGSFYNNGVLITPALGLMYMDSTTDNVYQYTTNGFTLFSDKRNTFRSFIKNQCIISGCTNAFNYDDVLSYSLLQTFKFSRKVAKISASVNLSLETTTNESDSRTLRENEIIKFVAPVLKDVTNYSTYVKYIFNGNNVNDTVPPETNYELKAGEWLALFWKTNSSDYRYSYIKYGEGTIIKSTVTLFFDLNAANKVSNLANGQSAVVVDTGINNFVGTYQDGTLSGDATITIRDKDAVSLNNSRNNKCYFITDNLQTIDTVDYYCLFEGAKVTSIVNNDPDSTAIVSITDQSKFNQQVINNSIIDTSYTLAFTAASGGNPAQWQITPATGSTPTIITTLELWGLNYTGVTTADLAFTVLFNSGSSTYMLKTGEYFINNVNNRLDIYGSGTLLKRTNKGRTLSTIWMCPTIDKEKVLLNGLEAFTQNEWFFVDTENETLDVQSTAFVNVLAKGTVMLQGELGTAHTVNITHDGTNVITVKQDEFLGQTTLPPYSMDMSQNQVKPLTGDTLNIYPNLITTGYTATDAKEPSADPGDPMYGYIQLTMSTENATAIQAREFTSYFNVGIIHTLTYKEDTADWVDTDDRLFSMDQLTSGFGIEFTNLATTAEENKHVLAEGDQIEIQLDAQEDTTNFVIVEPSTLGIAGSVVSGVLLGLSLIADRATGNYTYAHFLITYSTDLGTVTIQYKNNETDEYTQLESSQIEGFNYTAYSIMTLSIEKGTTTYLYENQKLYLTLPDETTETVEIQVPGAGEAPILTQIASNYDILLGDQEELDVSLVDTFGQIVYPTLMVFTIPITSEFVQKNDKILLTDIAKDITFNQGAGYYILPVFTKDLTSTLTLKLDSGIRIADDSTDISILNGNGNITVTIDNETTFKTLHPNEGMYTYTYNNSVWLLEGKQVSLLSEGISMTGVPEEGDFFSVFNLKVTLQQITPNGTEIVTYYIIPVFENSLDESTHTLSITSDGTAAIEGTIKLGNLLKVTEDRETFYNVANMITSVNAANNYAHDIDLITQKSFEVNILSPLNSNSFFDKHHYFNHLTIGEMSSMSASFIGG